MEFNHQVDKRQDLLFRPLALLFAALVLTSLIRTSFDDSMELVHSIVCTLLAQAWILPLVLGKLLFPKWHKTVTVTTCVLPLALMQLALAGVIHGQESNEEMMELE